MTLACIIRLSVDEVCRVGVVGVDATHLGRSQVDLGGRLFGKKGVHGGLVAQVQLGMRAGDDLAGQHALLQEGAHNGAAHHATVACNKNLGVMQNGNPPVDWQTQL
jgi:hypothetical protein